MIHTLRTLLLSAAIGLANSRLVLLANDHVSDALASIGFANEITGDGTVPAWIEIPYGNFDHKNGMQLFDRSAADTICANFKTDLLQRIKGGVPWYVGHPDVPEFANQYRDKGARGWIKEMEATDKALRLRVKWNPAGESIIANEEYKYFSPVWAAQPVAGKARTYRPMRLRSVGFTNDPNLPVEPLTNANEKDPTNMPTWLLEMLGLAPEATEEDAKAALGALIESAKKAADAPAELENERTLRTTAETTLSNVRNEEGTRFANERSARIELMLDVAQTKGVITPATRPQWKTDLTASFEAKAVELANAKPVLSTSGRTKNLGTRIPTSSAADEAKTLANERKAKTGESWDVCWAAVQKSRPDLFAQMNQTASAN